MEAIKTDNGFLSDKVRLRADHLPAGELVRVLDCFAGKGVIWECVKRITGRAVRRLPIDTRNDLNEFHLHGDNRAFLETIDLSQFDVIDLDAYGAPYDQVRQLVDRGFSGTVFVTFIQSNRGGANHHAMQDIGFSKEILEEAPSLFARRGKDYFFEWLGSVGVRKISYRAKKTGSFLKVYGTFILNGAGVSAAGLNNRAAKTPAGPFLHNGANQTAPPV